MSDEATRSELESGVRQGAYTSGAISLRDVDILVDMIELLKDNKTKEALQILHQSKFVSIDDFGGPLNVAAATRVLVAVQPVKQQQDRQDW